MCGGGKSDTSEGCPWEPQAWPAGSQTLPVSSLTSSPPPRHTLSPGPHGRDDGSWAMHTAGHPEHETESSPGPEPGGVCEPAQKDWVGAAGTPTGTPWGTYS